MGAERPRARIRDHFQAHLAVISPALLTLLLSACAGPTTPLGAIRSLMPAQKWNPLAALTTPSQETQIWFYPTRQVLHDKFTLSIFMRNPKGLEEADLNGLQVLYAGYDISPTLLKNAELRFLDAQKLVEVRLQDVRLPPENPQSIEVYFSNDHSYAQLQSPECSAFDAQSIRSTQGFNPSGWLLFLIERLAKENGLNPNYVAALIAQESGFNPKALSWAKALGLTQITPTAADHIRLKHPEWPTDSRVDHHNYTALRKEIEAGLLSDQQDWRLNPRTSIEGGIEYLQYLRTYWGETEARRTVTETFEQPDTALFQILLASYHSGPARVRYFVEKKGKDWLDVRKLKEARRYINRILSYCYHFGQEEISYENPT